MSDIEKVIAEGKGSVERMVEQFAKEQTLTVKQAADFLHVKPQTLDKFRMQKTGPAYSRIGTGRGKILYRLSVLVEYLSANEMRTAA